MKSKSNSLIVILCLILPIVMFFPSFQRQTGSEFNPELEFSQEPDAALGETYFKYGGYIILDGIDPHDVWDTASINFVQQICEGLFTTNTSDPEFSPIPQLAEDYGTWNISENSYTVNLRTGVLFQDGQPFNATAVQWNFDRLNNLIGLGQCMIAELYQPRAGEFPGTPLLINRTEVLDTHTVKFVLNYPFTPFESLLTCWGSSIMSPASTPFNETLDRYSDTLVGTGSYTYTIYLDDHIEFDYFNNNYTTQPDILSMKWYHYSYNENSEKYKAFTNGSLDLIDELSDEYQIYVDRYPALIQASPKEGQILSYIAFNNDHINKTMRQAMNFAFNYTAYEETLAENVNRLESYLPSKMQAYDDSFPLPDFNITHARQILIDAGIAGLHGLNALSTDNDWRAVSEGGTPIASYNYTYNIGNINREKSGNILNNSLPLIGVNLSIFGLDWSEFLPLLFSEPHKLDICSIGWGPDYNDPNAIFQPLFSNTSTSNIAQVNDPWLQSKIYEGMSTENKTLREQIYTDIQEYLMTDLMPWVLLYATDTTPYHSIFLDNFQPNYYSSYKFSEMAWYGNDPDDDGDGLTNPVETIITTNLGLNDTDGDGLLDGEEVITYFTNPLYADIDSDSLNDYQETLIYFTDTYSNDTDGDLMLDPWEVANWLNPLIDDSLLDLDGDGVLNYDEFLNGTNPTRVDSDNDNFLDGYELYMGTDPNNSSDHPYFIETDYQYLEDYLAGNATLILVVQAL
ncbi:MAG: ABC transporter substrate-binding protein, partial [Promethearchaeota archaeon]